MMCLNCKQHVQEGAAAVHSQCVSHLQRKRMAIDLRAWTLRKKTIGVLSPEVAQALEECASDMEQG